MAVLDQKQREKYATVGDDKFPIPDKAHPRAALVRLNQAKPPLTHEQKMRVIKKAHAMLGEKKSSK